MLKPPTRHRTISLQSPTTPIGRVTATSGLFGSRVCRMALVLGCMTALLPGPAQAEWRQHLTGTGSSSRDIVNSIALAPSGDAVAAGAIDNGGTGIDLAVVKLGGATGEVLWQREIPGVGDQEEAGLDVVVDAAGDAYVAGELDLYFSVVKFSGADGSEIWRAEVDGTNTTFRIPQLAQSLAQFWYTRPLAASSRTSRQMFVSCMATPRSTACGNAASSDTPSTPHIIRPTVLAT